MQVAQSRHQLIEYLTWKDGYNRQFFKIFRNLRNLQQKARISRIAESNGVTYVGEKRCSIDALVPAF